VEALILTSTPTQTDGVAPWSNPVPQEAATAQNCSLCPQDSNLTVYTNNPDLTPCFQNSLLAWVPCIYLWAALPCYLFYLRHHRCGYIVLSVLSRLKTVRGSGLPNGWGGLGPGDSAFNEPPNSPPPLTPKAGLSSQNHLLCSSGCGSPPTGAAIS
jgi:hypothetical protein